MPTPVLPSFLNPRAAAVLFVLIDGGQPLRASEVVVRIPHQALDVVDVVQELEHLVERGFVQAEPGGDPLDDAAAAYRYRESSGLVVDSPCGRQWFVPQEVVDTRFSGDATRMAWTDVERDGLQLKSASPEQVCRALDAIRSAAARRPHQVLKR